MDNLYFNCVTDNGFEKGLFQAMVYGKNEVVVIKIYSWNDDNVE